MEHLHKAPPLRALPEEKAETERVGREYTEEAVLSRYNRSNTQMNSQTTAAGTRLAQSKPDGVLGLRGKVDTSSHP